MVSAIVDHLDDAGRTHLMEQRDDEQNTPLLLAAQVADWRVRDKLSITVSPGWQQ